MRRPAEKDNHLPAAQVLREQTTLSCIYFLDGGIEKVADCVFLTWWGINDLLDAAIPGGHIHPMIFNVPNSKPSSN